MRKLLQHCYFYLKEQLFAAPASSGKSNSALLGVYSLFHTQYQSLHSANHLGFVTEVACGEIRYLIVLCCSLHVIL